MGEVIRLPVDGRGVPRPNRERIMFVIKELASHVYGRNWGFPAYRYMGYYELLGQFDYLKERMIIQQALDNEYGV